MPPRITDQNTWQQAELLMQPAFIRVIDNLRKQLEESTWQGTYQEVLIWPPHTSDETKAVVTQLLQEMESATLEEAQAIRENLARLPMPHPGYHLCLQRQDQNVSIDLWELCYQVCFINYISESDNVVIDASLIDEFGEVDWQHLETKTKELVTMVFANLPDTPGI